MIIRIILSLQFLSETLVKNLKELNVLYIHHLSGPVTKDLSVLSLSSFGRCDDNVVLAMAEWEIFVFLINKCGVHGGSDPFDCYQFTKIDQVTFLVDKTIIHLVTRLEKNMEIMGITR